MAFPTGWNYRKSHIITQQAGAGTNYQVGIKVYYGAGVDGTEASVNHLLTYGIVYCDSNCKTDFGDIRFKNSNGAELDYWMEEKIDSDYAIFWVEISDNLTAGNVTIYIYYGMATATYLDDYTDMQHGDNTFLFFDNFNVALDTVNKWDEEIAGLSTSGGNLEVVGTSGQRGRIESKTPISYGAAFHSRAQWSDTKQWGQYWCGTKLEDDFTHSMRFYGEELDNQCSVRSYDPLPEKHFVTLADTVTDMQHYSILWLGEDNARFFQNAGLLRTHSNHVPDDDQRMFFYESNIVCGTIYVDWCFVRKLIATEPVHGAWGAEEFLIVASGSVVPLMQVLDVI